MTPEEEKNRTIKWQQQHLQFKAELMTNDIMLKFLENAYPSSRESFISDYARQKVQWLEWGPKNAQWLEREDLSWVNDATERLKEIQQKKLFDIQCLWRAEKITLPGVEVSCDFEHWEEDIFNCPFIDPVTESEVEMYAQYLQSENFEKHQGFMDSWQDYKSIKAAYNESGEADRNFPDWYDFHNGRTGLSVYLILPDIRGEKEDFYLDLWRRDARKAQEIEMEKIKAAPQVPSETFETPARTSEASTPSSEVRASEKAPEEQAEKRPALDYHRNGWMTWFVNTFEDKETQQNFIKYGGEKPFEDRDESLDEDLRLLSRADKTVPIDSWFDWREAIHKAASRYCREKIADALPVAFEQYKMHLDANISFEAPTDRMGISKWYRDAVLTGRELNGEPRDFDF
jgi:hypothetical protein